MSLPDGLLGDRYVLGDLLGRGGMADVHRAHDQVLDRPVAVKLLRDVPDNDADRDRFIAEARTLAQLNHRNLVTVLDAGTSGVRPYLVMELIEGRALADCCAGTTLDPGSVAAVGAQLAEALAYVHSCGIVHRDVKPGNVLLADDGRAMLTDFGIARLIEGASLHTAPGLTMGTAAYLAPEQVRGDTLTAAADIYSFGLVLLEALTGERAYPGAPAEAALARFSRPPDIPDALPAPWRQLLGEMTSLDPAARPNPLQVAETLRVLAAGADPASATIALATPAGAAPTRALTNSISAPPTATLPSELPRSQRDVLTRARDLLSDSARLPQVLAVAGVAVLLLVALVVAATRPDVASTPDVPAGLPPAISEDLQNLHEAVYG